MFKAGQKVVFIDKRNNLLCIVPKKDEVVTIARFIPNSFDTLCLVEYPKAITGESQCFRTDQFRPLTPTEGLICDFNIRELLVETSDCPIKDPSPKPLELEPA